MTGETLKVAVDVDHQRAITYAYLNSTRNVISRISVRNVGGETTAGSMVRPRVSIEAPFDEPVANVWHGSFQELPRPALNDPPLVTWMRVNPTFNARVLGQIAERANATLKVELLTEDDEVIWSSMFPVTLLAANEWLHDPSFYDALAAFVLPNSTALHQPIDRARRILEENTGDGSTAGYQLEASRGIEASTRRVYQMAEAAYEAIREVGLNYSNPPAAFENFVQRVRSPQTIMAERAATCLDSSVLYAAALGQIGLSPVLFLVEGHAFAGFAVVDNLFRNAPSVIDGRAEIQQLIERGLVQPVETTTLCAGPSSLPFNGALAAPERYFKEQVDKFDAMIVVESAWRLGIAPPPVLSGSLLEAVDGEHPAHAIRQTEASLVAGQVEQSDFEFEADGPTGADRPPPRVRQWMNSLLDLSSRNSLLRMSVHQKNGKETSRFLEFDIPPSLLGSVDDKLFTPRAKLLIQTPGDLPAKYKSNGITAAEFAAELGSLRSPLMYPSYLDINEIPARVRQLIGQRDAGKVPGNPTDLDLERFVHTRYQDSCEHRLKERLTKIRSLADESMLATGSNALHLALGVLSWSEESAGRGGAASSVEYAAPLFLYPVVLEGGKGVPFSLRLDGSGSITPNYCLQEKLRRPPYNLDLPELSTPLADAAGIDLDQMMVSIENKLRNAKLNNVAVQRRCVLGVFEYSTFRLWKDLHDNWSQMRDTSAVVRHLMYTPGQRMAELQPTVDATGREPYCPIEADDSQVEAIRWALEGRSFRLEGPPGTGKTQTITNLIASCLAHGKKILFVAEKQTALQQVKKRLHSVGLGDYCLELHAKGDSDARLRKNISEQVGGALVASADSRDSDWAELSAKVKAEERALDAYRSALHDLNSAELSLWKARDGLAALGDGPSFPVPRTFLDGFREHRLVLRELEVDLPNVIESAGGLTGNPWRLVDRLDFESLDRASVSARLAELAAALAEFVNLGGQWAPVLDVRDPDEMELLVAFGRLNVDGYSLVPGAFARGAGGAMWLETALSLRQAIDERVSLIVPHLSILGPDFAGRSDLDQVESARREAAAARWPSAGRRLRELQELVGGPALAVDAKAVSAAVEAARPPIADLSVLLERLREEVLIVVPGDAASDLSSMVRRIDRTIATVSSFDHGKAGATVVDLVRELASTGSVDVLATRIVDRFLTAWAAFAATLGVGAAGLARWRGERSLGTAVAESLGAWTIDRGEHNRYLRLQRWSDVTVSVNRIEECGLPALRRAVLDGEVDVERLGEMIQRGVMSAAVEERLEAGRIDNFDARTHDRRVANFERTLEKLRDVMMERIPGLVVARRQARRSKAGASAQTADLLRELKPIRGEKTPIRALLERYGTALVDVMPCFMMSPDSVATLLPVGAVHFDLVLFDEASQVKTSHAIGALGRGVASIVVGDSKQMPPTSAFSSNSGRFEAADEADESTTDDGDVIEGAEEIEHTGPDHVGSGVLVGAAARDVESILQEFEAAYVPHLQLLCHYRSKDELLIAFSNAEIYDKPMLTFPSTAGMASRALEFRRVDGQFCRKRAIYTHQDDPQRRVEALRTNPVEAQAVVEEVLARLRDPERRRRREAGKRQGAESIIVVTFNKPQQELISTLLEWFDDPTNPVVAPALLEEKDDETGVLIADPQLKVRNLETVQGDEAETVIFSVAFSKLADDERRTPSNRVPLNFGPVTQEGGHRRLNVAVTRAQRKMIVFCSFDPSDMDVKPTSSEGARMVQKFLLLAKNGPRQSGDIGVGGTRSKHLDEIARAIQGLGYRVQTQMGLSSLRVDIAVGLPDSDEWMLAVMADGPAWAERGSAYQREVLPKNILRSLGWKHVLRVWLPSWIDEPDEVLARIAAALADVGAGQEDGAEEEIHGVINDALTDVVPTERPSLGEAVEVLLAEEDAAEPSPADDGEVSDPERQEMDGRSDAKVVFPRPRPPLEVERPSAVEVRSVEGVSFVPFEPSERGGPAMLDLMHSGSARKAVLAVIEEVIEAEAPVVAERLGRLVANCFSLASVRQPRVDAILSLVDPGRIEQTALGRVVWKSPEQRTTWAVFRLSDEGDARPFQEVPLPELKWAVIGAVADGDHTRETAMRAVAKSYGSSKLGSRVRERLEVVVDYCIREGAVIESGGALRVDPRGFQTEGADDVG